MKKRALSLALALILLLTLAPVTALAAEDTQVYVTVCRNGKFVTGKTGEVMAYAPVKVTGDTPTVKDVFINLHELYFPDGTSGFGETGGFISRFWGVDSSSVGYYRNNSYVSSLTETVSGGDHIVFWFYQDTAAWSDEYTYFNSTTVSAAGGEGVSLTMSSSGGPVEGAGITVDGAALPGRATDETGGVTLYFAKSGTYTVSAAPREGYIVPPVCLVMVTGDDPDAKRRVEADAASLSLPETVTADLALPLTGQSGRTGITWTSSDEAALSASGHVFRGSEDKSVTLTANVSYGDFAAERTFSVTVKALDGGEELLDRAASLLSEPLEVSQYNEDGSLGDTNIVKFIREYIEAQGIHNVSVSMVSSTNPAIDGITGDITYMDEEASGSVTVKLTAGSASRDVTVSVTVPERTPTRQEVMDEAVEYLKSTILGGNEDFAHVKTDLDLPSRGSTINGYSFVQVNYTVPAEAAGYLSGSLGGVTRPDQSVGDVSFTLNLTVHWYSEIEMWIPSGYVGPTPSDQLLSFDITILAITDEERESTKAWLDGLDPAGFITYANGQPADLDAVAADLSLKEVPGAELTKWKSGNTDIISDPAYYTGTAAVTRPALGEEDAPVILTVTATRLGVTVSRDISVTVKAITGAETESDSLAKLLDSLTWDVIKGANTKEPEAASDLRIPVAASVTGTAVLWFYPGDAASGAAFTVSCGSDDPALISSDGRVTRPVFQGGEVKLTFTFRSVRYPDQVPEQTKELTVTVPPCAAPGSEEALNGLLDTIASGYREDHSHWEIISDMSAYHSLRPQGPATSDAARREYISSAIGLIAKGGVSEAALAGSVIALHSTGADPTRLYPNGSEDTLDAVSILNSMEHSPGEWTAPYVLWAWREGGSAPEGEPDRLISAILTAQHGDGSWDSLGGVFATPVDSTANMLIGLAPYLAFDGVEEAVEKALTYFSDRQDAATGGFSGGSGAVNANSTALVLTALCGLGINPYADSRFITANGKSAPDGLMSFALDDNSGFGYTDNTSLNALATRQGFTALLALRSLADGGAAVYDFSSVEVGPAYAVDDPADAGITSVTLTPGDVTDSPDDEDTLAFKVSSSVSAVRLTVECAERTASVALTGEDVSETIASGETSGILDLDTGDNLFTLTVTAPDGETRREYTVTVERSAPSSHGGGGGSSDISVYFTLTGDTHHGSTGAHRAETWIRRQAVTVPTGSTVKYLTELMLNNSGIDYVSDGGYISEINGLAELDNGPRSGWIFRVNSTLPDVGYGSYTLRNGDSVVWCYTDDYTREPDHDASWDLPTRPGGGGYVTPDAATGSDGWVRVKVDENTAKSAADDAGEDMLVTVAIDTGGSADKVSVELPAGSVNILTGRNLGLAVKTGICEARLTAEGLASVTGGLTVTIEKTVDGAAIAVYDGALRLTSLPGGIKIALPAEGDVLVTADGGETVIKKSAAESGLILALLKGSAQVSARSLTPTFDDVSSGGWFFENVRFVCSHELMEGVGGGLFDPEGSMTRAMLATVLWRLEDTPQPNGETPFADVPAGAWYASGVSWANETGIVHGTGSGFAPEVGLTREMAVTMLYRYASVLGLDTGARADIDSFTDAGSVSAWAREAFAWAVAAGIVEGSERGELMPGKTALRTQCAAMLERTVKFILK